MRVVFCVLLLAVSASAQTVTKRTGEIIYLTVCGAQGDTVNFYRKSGVTLTPTKIGSIVRTTGVAACKELQHIMPSGTTMQYRFFAVPSVGVTFLDETNGVRVMRKP